MRRGVGEGKMQVSRTGTTTDDKILFVLHSLPSGGIERVVATLCRSLPAKGYTPAICCLVEEGAGSQAFRRLGLPLNVLPGISSSHPRHFMRNGKVLHSLIRHMQELQPQVVQAEMFYAGTLGRLAAAFCRVPTIVHGIHNYYPWKGPIARAVDRFATKFTTAIVTPTAAVAEYSAHQLGIDRSRFRVIANGLFVSAARHTPRQVCRRELDIEPDDEVVVHCARLVEQKRPEVAIAAIEALAPRRPKLQLVIVGDGKLLPRLQTRVRRSGSRIRLVGRVDDPGKYYRAADLVVLPSTREGFGLVPGEALLAGTPVLMSDLPPLREVYGFLDEETFVKTPEPQRWAGAIARALDNPRWGEQQVETAGAALPNRYAIDRMVDEYVRLYERRD